jgi:hypothetical protein
MTEHRVSAATIRQIEFELERAEHGMAMPYDPERVAQLRSMLREVRKQKLSAGLRARRQQGNGLGEMTKIRTHLKHNIFMLDEADEILEHLGGAEDYLLAAQLYELALKRWPMARIQMRQGARVVYDSRRSAVV